LNGLMMAVTSFMVDSFMSEELEKF
jgi:hypothetical protein